MLQGAFRNFATCLRTVYRPTEMPRIESPSERRSHYRHLRSGIFVMDHIIIEIPEDNITTNYENFDYRVQQQAVGHQNGR